MLERTPDTAICIPVDDYKHLITVSALYEELTVRYWQLKAAYDELAKASAAKPVYGPFVEDKDVSDT